MEGTQDTRVDDRYRPITLHHLSDSGNLIFIIFMKVGGVIPGPYNENRILNTDI